MAQDVASVEEYLRALQFEVVVADSSTLTATRRVGSDTIRHVIRVLDGCAEAKRDPHRVAAALQAVRGRNKASATLSVIVLRASPEDVAELDPLYGLHRIRVFTYNSFLDSMIGAEDICRQIVTAMDFVRVHQTYVRQSVADEGGQALDLDSVEAVRTWMRKGRPGLLIILADAGHGKTSLTREIALELAQTRLSRPDAPVPIFVPFAEHRRVTDWAGLVLVRLQAHGVLGGTTDAFDFLLRAGRLILILDGFDEMSEESGTKIAEENLRMIASHVTGRGRIVLTSRSTFFKSSAEVAEIVEQRLDQSAIKTYELRPFSPAQRREFLLKTNDKAVADKVLSIAQGNDALSELTGSPLVLNMLAAAVADNPRRFTGGRNRAELYESYFKVLFERERKRQGHELSDDEQFTFLERISDSMFADRTAVYGRSEIAYFVTEALPRQIERLRGRRAEEEALTSKLCDHAAFSAEGSSIRFQHPTYRDYFAARYWAAQVREHLLSALLRPNLSDASISFVAELLTKDLLRKVAQQSLTRSTDGQLVRNVLRLIDAYCRNYYPSDPDLRRELFGTLVGSAPLALNSRDLSGIALDGAKLRGASLVRANLDGARFVNCDLDEANLTAAFLRMTLFDRSSLKGTQLGDLSQFVSVRIGRADMTIADLELAREKLAKLGASIAGHTPGGPSGMEITKQLLTDQFRRFKSEGRGNWELKRTEETLVRGLEGKRRTFVERKLIPALLADGYYEKSKVGAKTTVRIPHTREARRLVDEMELSVGLQAIVDRLADDATRLMEL